MIGAGAPKAAGKPRGADEPSPGQVWPAVASCSRFWPVAGGSGLAAARRGAAELG
jgi:hypothetical protein